MTENTESHAVVATPGELVDDTAVRAIRVANSLQRDVTMVHNDKHVTVRPGDRLGRVVNQWSAVKATPVHAPYRVTLTDHTGKTTDITELRITDPDTGGMKGSKLAKFSSIPSDVLWELAEHFGRGEQKYPNDPETGKPNWQRGYDWRLNVDALQRHLHQFLLGEEADPETGSSHLIAVVWHAMVLRWFQLHGMGRDFR